MGAGRDHTCVDRAARLRFQERRLMITASPRGTLAKVRRPRQESNLRHQV